MSETARRGRRRAALALTALLLVLACRGTGAEAAPVPWATGFGNLDFGREYEHLVNDQTKYLRRKTDVFTSFYIKRGSIGEAEAALPQKLRLWGQLTKAGIRIAQVVPLVMDDDGANIARILNPADPLHARYVAFWTALGEGLKTAGAERAVVRIGHEMNLTGGYQWSYGNPRFKASDFAPLYKLAADAIRSKLPDAVRCWNPGKKTAKGTPEELWPGDSYVDLVCLDFYDNGVYGFVTSDAAWRALVDKTDRNGPVGINSWYKWAKARGKRLAVPEWGLTDPKKPGAAPTDRPVYIQKMYDYFRSIAAKGDLEFESYYNYAFNGRDSHQLYPVLPKHRRSSQLYQRLFGVAR